MTQPASMGGDTSLALFDPFVDQVDTAELREGAVIAVDRRFGRDLASARPMDAALCRMLDEHLALRVALPRVLFEANIESPGAQVPRRQLEI
jgi:hypothetical protein